MRKALRWLSPGILLATAFFSCSNLPLLAAEITEARNERSIPLIDTHVHLVRGYGRKAAPPTAAQALGMMDSHRIETAILLPQPFPPNHPGIYGLREIEPLARAHPGRFAFAAGGGSLNPMIHSLAVDQVTPESMREFRQEAEAIAKAGAAAFGELTAEHFSSGRGNHPYESARPDHPLFLALADLAAQHGLPIDLHMEAVPQDMPFPRRFGRGQNPEALKENISGLERLLAHNRNARVVWAHAGWDLSGERTVPLMLSLLEKHPNLYMSMKLDSSGTPRSSPFRPDEGLRPGWLTMLRKFPDRFVIGSDQFFDEGPERLGLVRKFIDALPPKLARLIASENARRIYRLGAAAK